MGNRSWLVAGFLGLIIASGAYASCPNGSNTTTSATFCSGNLNLGNGGPSQTSVSIPVSGMSGAVSGITVTLSSFTHPYPYEVNLMLVGPGGSPALTFLGGDCGDFGNGPSNITMILVDGTTNPLVPSAASGGCTTATYRPYVDEALSTGTSGVCISATPSSFSSPAPSNVACANNPSTGDNTFTSTFTGATPNGSWTVYAYNSADDEGSIGSIYLTVTTELSESSTTTSVSVNPNEIFNSSPSNSSTFTATVTSGGGTVNEGEVQFYDNGATAGTPVAVSGGQAQLDDIFGSSTPEGLHQITAVYTDNATTPKFETSNNNSNPADLFINNHTTTSNGGYTFCNSGTITIANSGNTSPYPQHVFVNGLSGGLASVTLTLNDINGSYGLADWYALLVGPDGKAFVPLAAAGGYAATHGVTLTLSDSGGTYLAQPSSNTAPASGTYLPTAFGQPSTSAWPTEGDTLWGPPQSGYFYPYSVGTATFGTTFASENLDNPSGPWSLYIYDSGGDSDTVGGYCLNFVTNNAAATNTTVSANPNPDITGTQTTLTAKVTSGGNPVTNGSVKFEQQGNPTPLGTANLDGSGSATINFAPSTEGQYTITAIYSGVSGTYNTSSGSTTLQVDNQTTETNNGSNNYSFCNAGPITLTAASNTPQQYPSRVLVSGLAGEVSQVTLTLDSLTYNYNSDLEMMLAGPNSSNNIVFWAAVGGDGSTNDQNFTIQDGQTTLPSTNDTLLSGTYAPTAYNTPYTLSFAAPAPSSPNFATSAGTATLGGQFDSTNPDGYWSFYVMEPGGGDHGSIGQHCVNLTITPPALAVAKSHTGSFTQGSNGTYTINVANNGPGSTLGTLTLTDTLPTGMSGISMSETGNTGGGTGSDWSCTASSATCTRTTAMPSGETDTITLTVSVGYNTPTGTNAVTNSVNVSGGGAGNSPTASDQTTINPGPQYVLTTVVSPSADGSVTPNPTNSPYLAANHYYPGTTVTLTATANTGYNFSTWSGNNAGDLSSTSANPTTVTMNHDETVTANFVVNDVAITINTSPAGLLVSVDGGTAQTAPLNESWQVGSNHTIATSSPQGASGTRYTWTSWSDSGAISHQITVPSSAATYTANFSTSYLLTTAANPSGGGTVTVNTASPTSDGYYAAGTPVSLTANPSALYAFTSWSGSGDLTSTSANPTMVNMNAPETVTANFMLTYTSISGSVSVTETGVLFSPLLNAGGGGGTTTFTVTNTSGQTVSGPVQLVLTALPGGVSGANDTGTFMGNPFWTVPNSTSLANGASLSVAVQLNYPSSTAVSTTPNVYTGNLQ